MKKHSRVWAEIDLDAIGANYQAMYEKLGGCRGMIAVVKTDGYGHGAVPIAELLEPRNYIWGFAVAAVEEAQELRRNGITKPILILGYTFREDYRWMAKEDIRPTVFKYDMAAQMSEAALAEGKKVFVHMAVDTGMTRIGLADTEEGAEEAVRIAALPGIRAEGLFTHFARADEADKSHAETQFSRYIHFLELLKEKGVEIPLRHCSNSAAILEMPGLAADLVRPGITGYGIYPSEEVSRRNLVLRPAMSLKSHIVYIKDVEAGTPVSYGGTYVTEQKMRIATIPVGYGDGYPRSLSNKGWVLIHGKKAPILGRVCMDQFMVDVTGIPEAKELDEAVLMGESEGNVLDVDILGKLSGRFPYEFVCNIGKRVPRVYIRDGKFRENP
ncbi:MAG: alanine racemase [Lachnospiraceae bacterium]|nr:alanine racemase [Lachnospiraceae bacterium]